MAWVRRFMLFCLIIEFQMIHAQENFELSYIAQQMNNYCNIRGGGGPGPAPTVIKDRVGKAGPPGSPGVAGPPGVVDYTIVGEIIERKLRELNIEKKIDEALNKSEELMKAYSKEIRPYSCREAKQIHAKLWNGTGGVFDIYPASGKMTVFCDLETDGGGWTVFQRRMDGSVSFERTWAQYVDGFGSVDKEYWMGLENLHRLTSNGSYELRVDLDDWEGNKAYAKYTNFKIGSVTDKYRLTVGGYRGTAGNSLAFHNRMTFTTVDQDNDKKSSNCAADHGGGWWFKNCDNSNLNGLYKVGGAYSGNENGVEWHHWKNTGHYSMKFAEMKFRAKL